MELSRARIFSVFLIFATVLASGCVSSSDKNLSQEFDTDARDVELNSSASSLLNQSFSQNYNDYNVGSDLQVLMKTPVAPMRLNLSSEGNFNNSYSGIDTRTVINLGLGADVEESNQPVKSVQTNSSKTTTRILNSANSTVKTYEAYKREELGLSVAAIERIGVENSKILGSTGENNSEILIEIQTNKSDLLENYADIFETHAVNDDDSSMEDENDLSSFETTKTYAWVDRDSKKLEKFSYYGSAADNQLQARIEINFRH